MYPVDTATFGIPQPSGTIAVSLDGNYTVNALTFSNTGGGLYDITPGTGGVLTLANTGTAGAQVTVTAGTSQIDAPLSLSGSSDFVITGGGFLTINGSIGGRAP